MWTFSLQCIGWLTQIFHSIRDVNMMEMKTCGGWKHLCSKLETIFSIKTFYVLPFDSETSSKLMIHGMIDTLELFSSREPYSLKNIELDMRCFPLARVTECFWRHFSSILVYPYCKANIQSGPSCCLPFWLYILSPLTVFALWVQNFLWPDVATPLVMSYEWYFNTVSEKMHTYRLSMIKISKRSIQVAIFPITHRTRNVSKA